MSLHKLTAGDGYTYLTRQVAAGDSTERGYTSLGDYYAAKGESPGRWMGRGLESLGTGGIVTEQQMRNLFGQGLHPDTERIVQDGYARGLTVPQAFAKARLGRAFPALAGNEVWRTRLGEGYSAWNAVRGLPSDWPIPAEDRQRIHTDVARLLFQERFDRGPADERELGGFLAQVARPEATAVAGYDLTFTPVKSVSALWALAPPEIAGAVEAAHDAAVADTLAWLEEHAGYTRIGPRGVAQVPVRGLIAAAFTHRDSRAGDPDLHTHVTLSAKVETLDGRWLALDGRMIYRFAVAASERYNTLLEQEITRRVDGEFTERVTTPGKRPVRELTGIDTALNARWSTRARQIDNHRADLVAAFRTQHGRLPTAVELIDLSQQANLATRETKHEPRSLAEQRATWRAQAIEVLGSSRAVDRMIAQATRITTGPLRTSLPTVGDLAAYTVETLQESRAVWRYHHVVAEAARQVRALGPTGVAVEDLIEQVTSTALSAEHSQQLDMPDPDRGAPPALLRPDGSSVFDVAHSQLYTSVEILQAEQAIVTAAGTRGARTLAVPDVDTAIHEWSAGHAGRSLNAGQAALVRRVATDDRVVQLALAPAGTGKTTAMSALSAAWFRSGGTVLGLAPQASAAQELAEVIPGLVAETLAKLVYELGRPDPYPLDWIDGIDHRSLVIIDEAGLASTPSLAVAIGYIGDRGGRVLLVGDDRQRAASGAGGVLRDVESTHGALSLSEVLRFTDPTEGHASLALRAGDPSAVGYYADRDRVRTVVADTVADTVFQGWSADIRSGADSIMIAPTLDLVAQLNARARAARLAATGRPTGRERTLPNGEVVSVGDVIVTKKNSRTLSLGRNDFVRNNDRWTVTAVHPNGSITAKHLARRTRRRLPAGYVDKGHIRLGYAHTHAGVQGMTVGRAHTRRGTAHTIVVDSMTRNDLYSAMTRAADGTTAYVISPGQGDPHDVVKPAAITPQTAVETLTAIITRDGESRSATTETRNAADPFSQLGPAADAYLHAVVTAAETTVGTERLREITDQAEELLPGLTSAPAWDTLLGHLAMIAVRGNNPIEGLGTALTSREIDTARDPAAVLDWRLDPSGQHSQGEGPLPWLPAIPETLTTDPTWGPYLTRRSHLTVRLARDIASAACEWTPATAPAWAVPYLTSSALTVDLARWRSAESVPDSDPRPAGPRPWRIALTNIHDELTERALRATGNPLDTTDRWTALLGPQAAAIRDDDYWPVLATRLTLAERAGLPAHQLLSQATDMPLPAEAAAAALWWRLAPHLGPTTDTHVPGANQLRPAWTQHLADTLGTGPADRITNDRLWPTIVARMDQAVRDGIDPRQLITDAVTMLAAHRGAVPDHETATVLLWTIGTLADPEPPDPDQLPPDPADEDIRPPLDAELTQQSPVSGPGPKQSRRIEPVVRTDRIYEALAAAQNYYTAEASGSWVPDYLASRRLDPTIAGYAPDSWTSLTAHLLRQGFTPDELTAAGLSKITRRHTLIDVFRDRAMLPVTEPNGRIAAFIGRKSPTNSHDYVPKYLNSPHTAVYDKATLPYGLTPDLVAALRRGTNLAIVEGPFDVEAIAASVPPDELVAVAATGTSLTPGQLHTLNNIAPLSNRLVIAALDDDPAGRRAAARAHLLLAEVGVTHPRTIDLHGKDPADLLEQGGPQQVRDAFTTTRPLADLLIDNIINRWPITDGTIESRVNAMHAAAPVIAALPADQANRQIRRVSGALTIELAHVTRAVELRKPFRSPHTTPASLDLPEPPHLSATAHGILRKVVQHRWGTDEAGITTIDLNLTLTQAELAIADAAAALPLRSEDRLSPKRPLGPTQSV